ncbi:universal stress protein [Phreatobacter stygius]|uniref:Universal stress protein n=1 Tax=Phreatobacter stygius TaxID=1940610 RepID=A0A4D7BA88_9HYPH|nr:universal stress protein [Phreatobacter stygius]QCI67613.1 universal stress protein [Phreatobacter stygius]
MYHHILIPTDGSPLSAMAVDKSIAFAQETGAGVTVLTVVEPFHIFSAEAEQLASSRAEYRRHAREAAANRLADAELKARERGVPCSAIQVEHDHPYQAIIDTAAEKGCDLIAMASHGRRGVSALVLGSETVKVLTHSKTPVLVYR